VLVTACRLRGDCKRRETVSRRIWQFVMEGEQHVVDLEWNSLGLTGKLNVDNKLVDQWGPLMRTKEIWFEIGGRRAMLSFIVKSLKPVRQVLYIDGFFLNVDSGNLEDLSKRGIEF
jgi:hypothetical protein